MLPPPECALQPNLLHCSEISLSNSTRAACRRRCRRAELSCLSVILEVLERHGLSFSALRPRLYARCLRVLVTLAAHPLTQDATLAMLSPETVGPMLAGLNSLLGRALPDEGQVHARAAALRQRACVLQLQALQLLRASDPRVSEPVLRALFDLQPGPRSAAGLGTAFAATAGGGGGAPLQALLGLLVDLDVQPASLKELGADERRMLAELTGGPGEPGTEALLGSAAALQQYGLLRRDSDDEPPLIDFDRLTELLRDRCARDAVFACSLAPCRLPAALLHLPLLRALLPSCVAA